MSPRYFPPAELVERARCAICATTPGDSKVCKIACAVCVRDARACLVASGLGEAVEVLRKALSLVDGYKVATDAEKAIAEEARALLARLDTRP